MRSLVVLVVLAAAGVIAGGCSKDPLLSAACESDLDCPMQWRCSPSERRCAKECTGSDACPRGDMRCSDGLCTTVPFVECRFDSDCTNPALSRCEESRCVPGDGTSTCVDSCTGLQCGEHRFCSDPTQTPRSCGNCDASSGQSCADGQCVASVDCLGIRCGSTNPANGSVCADPANDHCCNDECTAEGSSCSADGTKIVVCRNLDTDECLEQSEIPCESGTCVDAENLCQGASACDPNKLCSLSEVNARQCSPTDPKILEQCQGTGSCPQWVAVETCTNVCNPSVVPQRCCEIPFDCTGKYCGSQICGRLCVTQDGCCIDGEGNEATHPAGKACNNFWQTCNSGNTAVLTCSQGLADNDDCFEVDKEDCIGGSVCVQVAAEAAAECCTHDCLSGQTKCEGNQQWACGSATNDADACNDWVSPQTCGPQQACSGNVCACTTGVCTSGTQCSGNIVQTCVPQPNGQSCWQNGTNCASSGQICVNGSCQTNCSNQCAVGTWNCSGNVLQQCQAGAGSGGCNGWVNIKTCGPDQTCNTSGTCSCGTEGTCSAGSAARCNPSSPNSRQTCDDQANGDWCWDTQEDCASSGKVCSNGACVLNCSTECTIGAKRCISGQEQTCVDGGASACNSWSTTKVCGADQECLGNLCVCSEAACTSGSANRCSGSNVQRCDNQGNGTYCWDTIQSCGALGCNPSTATCYPSCPESPTAATAGFAPGGGSCNESGALALASTFAGIYGVESAYGYIDGRAVSACVRVDFGLSCVPTGNICIAAYAVGPMCGDTSSLVECIPSVADTVLAVFKGTSSSVTSASWQQTFNVNPNGGTAGTDNYCWNPADAPLRYLWVCRAACEPNNYNLAVDWVYND